MSEQTTLPRFRHLLVVAACPEELLVPLGAMVSAFADADTVVCAVLLSDGLGANSTSVARVERNHRLVRAAERLGVAEVIMLDHSITDVPRTGVQAMAAEVLGASERADAVLVADPHDRRDRSARGRLAAFRAALRVATVIGAPIYVRTAVRPGPRARPQVTEVAVSRVRQRSAIAYYSGVPEALGRRLLDEDGVEYLLSQRHRPVSAAESPQPSFG